MNTANEISFALPDETVYVRAVRADEIDGQLEVPPGVERLYAVHDQTGRRIGLFDDRDIAFALARNNALSPVSVH